MCGFAHDPGERRVARESFIEPSLLSGVHDEDDVRPLEHPGVHVDQRVWTRAGRAYVEPRILAENTFGGRAAASVVLTHEEHPHGPRLRGTHLFG
ncbi:MAG: hypothetical protein DMF84_06965 [Acidobacteria bacterium]|nr:MAG: hypothetical protein DMF84_06965 [Acidobacteriota bacterium]